MVLQSVCKEVVDKEVEAIGCTVVLLTLALVPVLPQAHTAIVQQTENKAGVQFSTSYICDSHKDVFTRSEVTGRR